MVKNCSTTFFVWGLHTPVKKEVVEFRHAYAKNKFIMSYHTSSDVKKQDALQALYNHGFKWVVVHKGKIVFKIFYEYQALNYKRLMNLWGAKVVPVNDSILEFF
ncbi:Uncharacterised protein [Salmonella enterica]|nr:Uncharacterised protein [Salmonella enterica]